LSTSLIWQKYDLIDLQLGMTSQSSLSLPQSPLAIYNTD